MTPVASRSVAGRSGQRYGVAFVEVPFAPPRRRLPWVRAGCRWVLRTRSSVVTGAAGRHRLGDHGRPGQASGGTFHLLDLTRRPTPTTPTHTFRADKNALRATIATRLKESGQSRDLTPSTGRSRASNASGRPPRLIEVVDAGGTAYYYSVDLTTIRPRSPRFSAPGARAVRPDRCPPARGGWPRMTSRRRRAAQNTTSPTSRPQAGSTRLAQRQAIRGRRGRRLLLGRRTFRQPGPQTDYRRRTITAFCKVIQSCWTSADPWHRDGLDVLGGIGMATGFIQDHGDGRSRCSCRTQAWPEFVVSWSPRHTRRGIVAGVPGAMAAAEYHETGGLAADRSAPTADDRRRQRERPYRHHVDDDLHPAQQAFLHDHRIDGGPVLPARHGVLRRGRLPHRAARISRGCCRGCRLRRAGQVLPRRAADALTISAVVSLAPEGADLARCTLTASRQLPGQATLTTTTHFTGDGPLTDAEPEAQADVTADAPEGAADQGLAARSTSTARPIRVVEQAWATATARPPDEQRPADNHVLATPCSSPYRGWSSCPSRPPLWEAGTAVASLCRCAGTHQRPARPGECRGPVVRQGDSRDGGFDVVVTDGSGSVIPPDGYQTVQTARGPERRRRRGPRQDLRLTSRPPPCTPPHTDRRTPNEGHYHRGIDNPAGDHRPWRARGPVPRRDRHSRPRPAVRHRRSSSTRWPATPWYAREADEALFVPAGTDAGVVAALRDAGATALVCGDSTAYGPVVDLVAAAEQAGSTSWAPGPPRSPVSPDPAALAAVQDRRITVDPGASNYRDFGVDTLTDVHGTTWSLGVRGSPCGPGITSCSPNTRGRSLPRSRRAWKRPPGASSVRRERVAPSPSPSPSPTTR